MSLKALQTIPILRRTPCFRGRSQVPPLIPDRLGRESMASPTASGEANHAYPAAHHGILSEEQTVPRLCDGGPMKLSETVSEVIALAEAIRNYWDAELPKRHPDYPFVHPGEDDGPPPPEEQKLK